MEARRAVRRRMGVPAVIKDLIVPITNTAGDGNALATAVALASRESAHLTVLEIVDLPVPADSPWGLLPDLAMSDIHDTLRARANSQAALYRGRLARESVSFEVRVVESLLVDPPSIAAMHGRYSDLTVVTAATEDGLDAPVIDRFFSTLLLESGRPVLVVPPKLRAPQSPRHVVVAWQPTREATRALHDAMPLLHAAESIDVLEVDPVGGEHGDGPTGSDIATHLARHGLKVRVVVHQRRSESVAVALSNHVEQAGAGLLVAGGYGHSRIREWVLGGVTRELLRSASVPVLFSH